MRRTSILIAIFGSILFGGVDSNDDYNDTDYDVQGDVEFVDPYNSNARSDVFDVDDATTSNETIEWPMELRVTTLQDMPFSGTVSVNGTEVGVGHAFYILDLLKERMNFTYRIVLPKNNVLGDQNMGIFGLLYKKEVDLAAAFIPAFPKASKWVLYGTALDEVGWTILMKRPGESATGSGLLAPFDATVWTLILITVIAIGPLIYLVIYLRSKLCKFGEPKKYSYATCTWFVYGALLKQGSTLSPVTDSARLLFATWWIFITILTSFYTANLTAFLTLSKFTLPINSIKDLASKNQKWVTQKGHIIDSLLSETGNSELDPLRVSTMKHNGQFINFDDKSDEYILKYVKSNKMYIRERPKIVSLIFSDYINKTRRGILEANRCTYVVMPGKLFSRTRSFCYQRNSSIAEIFDSRLLMLIETGIVTFKTGENSPGTEVCPLNLGSTDRQLRNSDLTMTYQCIGIGFSIAIFTFVVEVIYRYWSKRKKVKIERRKEPPAYRLETLPSKRTSPPPLCQSINGRDSVKKQFINGRDYYVVREKDGGQRLIPVRTPSAFLFQYTS